MAKPAILFGMLGAAMFAAPEATAQREWREVRVDISALDLSTAAGRAELDKRVSRAVTRICGGDRQCRDQAWASADGQVAWAIERDEVTRRLAAERAAQLAACGGYPCPEPAALPVHYAPPPPPPGVEAGRTTITIVHAPPPPPQVIVIQLPPPAPYYVAPAAYPPPYPYR